MLYASTQSFRKIANHLLEDRPDFLGVYFELLDATGHLFMQHASPRLPYIAEAEYEIYKDAIEQTYVLQDQIIGELYDRCDDNTVLMIVSDHGFKSGVARPKRRPEIWAGNAAFWHNLDGVICLYGKGILSLSRAGGVPGGSGLPG